MEKIRKYNKTKNHKLNLVKPRFLDVFDESKFKIIDPSYYN